MRLRVARALMCLPQRAWLRLPGRLRSWAVDEWLWREPSVQAQYSSRREMRRVLGSGGRDGGRDA